MRKVAEQPRIMAKVGTLTALMDEWEPRASATSASATRFLDALTNVLTSR